MLPIAFMFCVLLSLFSYIIVCKEIPILHIFMSPILVNVPVDGTTSIRSTQIPICIIKVDSMVCVVHRSYKHTHFPKYAIWLMIRWILYIAILMSIAGRLYCCIPLRVIGVM